MKDRTSPIDFSKLPKNEDGQLVLEDGTVLAINILSPTDDAVTRCGVGMISLPVSSELTDACRTHDNAYSNPAYQKTHTRKEADDKLYFDLLVLGAPRPVAWAMWRCARLFGKRWWNNPKTND